MNSDPVKEQEFMDHLTLFTADHPGVATPPPAVTVPSPPTNELVSPPSCPPPPPPRSHILSVPPTTITINHSTPHAHSLTEKFTAGVTLSKQSLGLAINAFLVQHTARPLDPHLADSCTVDESGVARLLKTDDDEGEEEEGAVDLELLMRCYKHLGRIEVMAMEKEEEEGGGAVGGEGTVSPLQPTMRECSLSVEEQSVDEVSPKTKHGAAAAAAAAAVAAGGGGGGGGGAAVGGGFGGGLGKRKRQRQDEGSVGPRTRSKVASS